MIVPAYWAESRRQHRDPQQQRTVRRFGWSDLSQEAAQAHADARAEEALARVLAGESLPSRDRKLPYNGAHGLPIREEVLQREGEAVLTRNSYGARCLNTPDVLFVDIDFPTRAPASWSWAVWLVVPLVGLLASVSSWWRAGSGWLLLGIVLFGLPAPWLAGRLHRAWQRFRGGPEAAARRRVEAFVRARPAWNMRLYRTPAGLRVLATHAVFDPHDAEVQACFKALGADPRYRAMCRNQRCFRARVSAKPWRIGIMQHLRPRPGVWPVAPERMALRTAWVADYEARAQGYAACRYLGDVGSGSTDLRVVPVRQWHDDLCRAHTQLPLA